MILHAVGNILQGVCINGHILYMHARWQVSAKLNNFLHAHAKTICKITTHSFKILLHSSLSTLVHMEDLSTHSDRLLQLPEM